MAESEVSIVDAPWTEGIAEENMAAVSKYENLGEFAKGHTHLVSKIGTMVSMPNAETPAEERSAFYQKLGMPGDVSGYSKPEMAEGSTLDEEFFGDMAGIAHAEGVSDKQFGAFVNRVIERQTAAAELKIKDDNRIAEESMNALRGEWKADFDKKVETSKRALRELAPDEIKEELAGILKGFNLDNNVLFIKLFQSIGAKMLDDNLVKGTSEKEKDTYKPEFGKSAEMYQYGEDDESKRARAYFEAQGHVYA